MGHAWTFDDQHCPNKTGYEWIHWARGYAYEGLTVKCIEEAGTSTWFGHKAFLLICCM